MLLVEKQRRVSEYFRDRQSVQLSTFVKKKKKKKLCSDNKEKDQPKISKKENKMAEGMDQCRFCLVPKKEESQKVKGCISFDLWHNQPKPQQQKGLLQSLRQKIKLSPFQEGKKKDNTTDLSGKYLIKGPQNLRKAELQWLKRLFEALSPSPYLLHMIKRSALDLLKKQLTL